MTLFRSDAPAGKRILVTGGGTGLGKEISLGFAAHGGHVFICGRREAVLKSAVEQIRAETGGSAEYAVVNVRDAASVEAMVADIWQSDPLTGLVNNAAANFIAPTETISPRGYEAIRSTVMDGSFFATLACGKRWIADGLPGVVVSNLVTWVWTGSAYVVPSAMAKSAVQAMTMSLAVEWGPKNIRLNAIAPGPFPTENAWEKLNPIPNLSWRNSARSGATPSLWQNGRAAQSACVPSLRRLHLYQRRYDRDRRRSSSGGAQHICRSVETYRSGLATSARSASRLGGEGAPRPRRLSAC
jgi:NAD(P)-dependent dehydrogenase (short-subunit alcohol dehydrogenase family)